jgi:hypothetical protein
MNSHCFVPGCTTGYPSQKKAFKIEGKKSLFTAPRVSSLKLLQEKEILIY